MRLFRLGDLRGRGLVCRLQILPKLGSDGGTTLFLAIRKSLPSAVSLAAAVSGSLLFHTMPIPFARAFLFPISQPNLHCALFQAHQFAGLSNHQSLCCAGLGAGWLCGLAAKSVGRRISTGRPSGPRRIRSLPGDFQSSKSIQPSLVVRACRRVFHLSGSRLLPRSLCAVLRMCL